MSLSQMSGCKSPAFDDRLKKLRKRDIHGDSKTNLNSAKLEDTANPSSTPEPILNPDRNASTSGNHCIAYEIINFMTVFGALSRCVQCKVCAGDVQFSTVERDGLAFKIHVKCPKCNPRFIESSPKASPRTYEINRRILFTMSTLGIDFSGLQWFCGLMDLPCIFTLSSYGRINKFLRQVASGIAQLSMTRAANLDVELSPEAEGIAIVGNTSWREGGSKFLHGIVAVIGKCSGKVLDVNVKASFCAACKSRLPPQGTPEYTTWLEEHERSCRQNQEGKHRQMEIDATCEIFRRSEEKYGIRYQSYVSKGDAKTFSAVRNSRPYGPDYEIHEAELSNSSTGINESFHSDLCRIPSNSSFVDIQIAEIAVFAGVIIFNDGYFRLLAMMGAFDLKMGRRAYAFFSEPNRIRLPSSQSSA